MELCPWRRSLTGALLACLAACTPIQFAEQEITLRHDAAADALEMLIVYDGVNAGPPRETDVAEKVEMSSEMAFALGVAGGEAMFMIFDWPFLVTVKDLAPGGDDARRALEAEIADPETTPGRRLEAEWRLWLTGTRVVSAGFCSGSSQRLSLHQTLRFEHAGKFIELAQAGSYLWIEESVAQGSLDRDTPTLDARTRELWALAAKEKRKWLFLAGDVLTVDLPMSEACAARLLAVSLYEATRDKGTFVAGLLSHVASVRIADERLVLTWKLDEPLFTFPEPEGYEYDEKLAWAIRLSEQYPAKVPHRSEIEKRFRTRPLNSR